MDDYQTLSPFQQFAVNASGTGIGNVYPSSGILPNAGLQGLGGMIESTPVAYALLVLGAAGAGAALATLKPTPAQGAMLAGGAVGAIVGMFGSSLSTPMRLGFGVAGLGLVAGGYLRR